MHTKLIRKVASILMLLVIMSTTFAQPMSNITKVIASTTDESAVATQQVATSGTTPETDTSTPAALDETNTTDIQIPSDTTAPDTSTDTSSDTNVDSSDSTIKSPNNSSGDTIDTTKPDTSLPDTTNDNTSTNDTKDVIKPDTSTTTSTTSAKATKSSTTTTPTAQQNPAPAVTAACTKDTTGNNPFLGPEDSARSIHVYYDSTLKSFVISVIYAGGPDVVPATSTLDDTILFRTDGGDEIIALPGSYFTNFGSTAHSTAIIPITPDQVKQILNTLKDNGTTSVKISIEYTNSDGSCSFKESNSKHIESARDFEPEFPVGALTASRTCNPNEIDLHFTYNGALHPTGATFKIYEALGVTPNPSTDTVVGNGTINTSTANGVYDKTISVSDNLSHNYYAVIDVFPDVAGADNTFNNSFNTTTPIDSSGAFLTSASITSVSLAKSGDTITPTVVYNLGGYSIDDVTITLTINGPGGYSNVITDPTKFGNTISGLGVGTYTATLSIDFGCTPATLTSDEIIIDYPTPTFTLDQTCDNIVNVTLDAGGVPPYPSSAKLIVEKQSDKTKTYYALGDTIPISASGNYLIYVSINGDNIIDPGEPVSDLITITVKQKPTITSVNLAASADTITPTVVYSLGDYASEASATLTINGPGGYSKIITNPTEFDDTISGLGAGTYTATLTITYPDCNPVTLTSAGATINYPKPTFSLDQTCDNIVNVTLDAGGVPPYPTTAKLIVEKQSDKTKTFYALGDTIPISTSGNYLIYVSINGDNIIDPGEPVSDLITITVKQKPTITSVNLAASVDTITPTVVYSLGDYASVASVTLTINGPDGYSKIISNPTEFDDTISGLGAGTYTATLTITYPDCAPVTLSDEAIVNYPTPTFTLEQTCDNIVDVTLNTGGLPPYPSGAKLIVEKQSDKTKTFYALGATIPISASGDYLIYVSLNGDNIIDPSEPVSDLINITVKQKPTITSVNLAASADTITPTVVYSLGDYASVASVTLTINGPGGYSKIITNPAEFDDTISGLGVGTYTATLTITYPDCNPVTLSNEATVSYPKPTFTPAQTCNNIVNVTLDDGGLPPYPEDARLIVEKQSDKTKMDYALSATIPISASGDYLIYVSLNGDNIIDAGEPVSDLMTITVKQIPSITSVGLAYSNGLLTPTVDYSLGDYAGAIATLNITSDKGYNNTITDITKFNTAISGLAAGTYTATLNIDNGECGVKTLSSRAITIYPKPVITQTPTCDNIVNLTLDSGADPAYPETAQLILMNMSDESAKFYSLNATIPIDTSGDYIVYVDLDGDGEINLVDPVSDTVSVEVKQIPSLGSVSLTYSDGMLTPTVEYSLGDYADAIATLTITSDNGYNNTITDVTKFNTAISGLDAGIYTAMLTINNGDCAAKTLSSRAVTIYPKPMFTQMQTCDNIVDLSLVPGGVPAYPNTAQLILMNMSDESTIIYPTDSTIPIDMSGDYIIYIDIDGNDTIDVNDPVSDTITVNVKQAPTINSVKLNYSNDMLTPMVDYDLGGYPDAIVTLIITGDNGYTNTITSDFNDAIKGLKPGTYSAMLTIDYGNDCNALTLESNPITIKEEPKLVYTGFETNFFETIIIDIKEFIQNAA